MNLKIALIALMFSLLVACGGGGGGGQQVAVSPPPPPPPPYDCPTIGTDATWDYTVPSQPQRAFGVLEIGVTDVAVADEILENCSDWDAGPDLGTERQIITRDGTVALRWSLDTNLFSGFELKSGWTGVLTYSSELVGVIELRLGDSAAEAGFISRARLSGHPGWGAIFEPPRPSDPFEPLLIGFIQVDSDDVLIALDTNKQNASFF